MILLLLMLLSRCSARWQDLLPVREVLLMSLLGYTGMLIGVYLDFGRLGLLSLNTICSSRDTLLTLGNWWQMFVLAPATHLLMMLACNAGLLLGACKRRSHLRRRLYWLVIIVSNTGMLAGMWLSQQWDPTPESGHLIRLIAEPATMALLMSILMLLLRDMTLYLARIGTFPGGRYKVRRSGVKQPDLFP
ncbi:MAG: hypothetical protein KDJ38_00645 [Gammaproteobacteria bacterium]|nr:hypothetical protein [Gammaproteobacteria bacterium]